MQNNPLNLTSFSKVFGKTVLFAVLTNLVILAIARIFINTPSTFEPFNYPSVAIFTIVGVVAASVVYLIIKKFSQNYNKVFKIVAYVALALSYIPDLMLPYSKDPETMGATPVTILVLLLMHTAAALWVIKNFTKNN